MHEFYELCLVAFHQHCLRPPSLLFSANVFLKIWLSSNLDEALFLAVVFIVSLSSLFQMYKKPLRERKLQLDEKYWRRPLLWIERPGGRGRGGEFDTEIVKVPLGIMQVPDIRCVFWKEHKEPLFKCRLPSSVTYWPLIPSMSVDFTYSIRITGERAFLAALEEEKWLHE